MRLHFCGTESREEDLITLLALRSCRSRKIIPYLPLTLVLISVDYREGVSEQELREEVALSVEVEVVNAIREYMLHRLGIHNEQHRALQDLALADIFGKQNEAPYVERPSQADDISMLTRPLPFQLPQFSRQHLVNISY